MDWYFALAATLVSALAYWRWLRVAQNEHYGSGRVFAIVALWLRVTPMNFLLYVGLGMASLIGMAFPNYVAMVIAAAWLSWPTGLRLRTRPGLAWTSRVKRLAAVIAVVHLAAAVFLWLGHALSMLPVFAVPIAELGLVVANPIERALGRKWQAQAAERLRQVGPRVVAITGSYGKTSTKNFAAHLIAGRWSVLASPASFNNAMGLSRAVNERLTPGTDVFVAEMGIYGPGEITALTKVFPPDVAAITTIGVAHLERMHKRSTIVKAKLEIVPPSPVVVLNVDVPELARAADAAEQAGKTVWRVSGAKRTVSDGSTTREVPVPEGESHPVNVVTAVALALAVDVPWEQIVERLPTLPETPHRAEVTRDEKGLTVVDDTFNSNPVGAAAAIAKGRSLLGKGSTLWVVTPGMVELGNEQETLNRELAQAATAAANQRLVAVGRTNRHALTKGGDAKLTRWFATREKATAWVMQQVAKGDVVVYENDLPDHYA